MFFSSYSQIIYVQNKVLLITNQLCECYECVTIKKRLYVSLGT